MSDAIKTSQQSPPSIVLSLAAWNLAWQRIYGTKPYHFDPAGRGACSLTAPATDLFYRILDRISAGEAP